MNLVLTMTSLDYKMLCLTHQGLDCCQIPVKQWCNIQNVKLHNLQCASSYFIKCLYDWALICMQCQISIMCLQRIKSFSSIWFRYLFQLSQSSTGTGEAMGNKLGVHGPGGPHDVTVDDRARTTTGGIVAASTAGTANGEDAEDPVVEVPPPMQPISSLPVAAAASSTSVDQKVIWNMFQDWDKTVSPQH